MQLKALDIFVIVIQQEEVLEVGASHGEEICALDDDLTREVARLVQVNAGDL